MVSGVSKSKWRRAVLATGLSLLAACGGDEAAGGTDPDSGPVLDGGNTTVSRCANGRDDDGDGLIDFPNDPGCTDAEDDDEYNPTARPQCSNGLDDDADGQTDFPADRGCQNATDNDESDDPASSQCNDQVDNDLDGYIDFPEDPGCASLFDDDEANEGTVQAQCNDAIDNDNDGLVDLADPGCGSPADAREADPETPAACSNGLDDDGNGLIDFPADPGCSAAGDEEELALAMPPACSNGTDDDNDGLTDYPADPGCAGAGDRDEADPALMPACADGQDNDRDGLIDHPDDFGCHSAGDANERTACGETYEPPRLSNGVAQRTDTRRATRQAAGSCGGAGLPEAVFFYRLTGRVEALEVSTAAAETQVETTLYLRRDCLKGNTEVACNRETLNDGQAANTLRYVNPAPGDYYLYVDGASGDGGPISVTLTEVPLAQCLNGADDDGDGWIDFPNDPGCDFAADRDEADPAIARACSNGEDDDADGLIDFPLDPGCVSAADDDEVDPCGAGLRVAELTLDRPEIRLDTRNGTNQFEGSCGGRGAREQIVRFANAYNANLTISVNYPETIDNTIVYVRQGQCLQARSEVGCNGGDGVMNGTKGRLRLERVPPGDLFIFVDHPFGQGGQVKLTVAAERLPPGCSDNVDNDGDGQIDGEDPGCADPLDEDEAHNPAAAPAACFNRVDDDADGLTDFPFDPGCFGKGDTDETDPETAPACANGLDDDEDGATDYPADFGCTSAGSDSEENNRPQCRNRFDDDQDGLTDWPADPGCATEGDNSEKDDDRAPQCSDEIDNDRNGLVDYPFDPGCNAAGDTVEAPPLVPAACSNRMDDDGDGRIDFPRDPGCVAAGDESEANPNLIPQCANGIDDDRNGRIDFPDDPGCRFAADPTEQLIGAAPRRCSDGVDNDDDGLIDLNDPGCAGARDDDETDLEVAPLCANGVDDDADGQTDWPNDDGCAAQGDECEQAGYGICEGVCLDIQTDTQNCGQCGRACDAGVECIEGFCGGLFVFEGIQRNVADDALGGWERCHSDTYGDGNTTIAALRAACDGPYVMFGCRARGAANWQLLAMGETAEAMRDTGDGNNQLNEHNGVAWYFSGNTSIGFTSVGTDVSRNSCDTNNTVPEQRMCWHTGGNSLNGGWRCGANTGLFDASFERAVWTSR